jgi:NAD(P)-dependent dehydrogenase (short-subunit alcohol dehydrogenase family)
MVIGTARDLDKARAATADIEGEGRLILMECNLASLGSVRGYADWLLADGLRFDVVIANAGVMACPAGKTEDGFETQFGTNHLGHFVLINRIASLLQNGGRVVVLASAGHRNSDVDFDDPNFERTEYDPIVAYGRSKTANALYAVELDRRLKKRGVRAASVHPGAIQTELARHLDPEILSAYVAKSTSGLLPFKHKTPEQGAATSLWAGFVAPASQIGGRYCEDCSVADIAEVDLNERKGVRPYAVDKERARALWAMSERMVGERFELL